MTTKTLTLSRNYQSALGMHMASRSASGLTSAGDLGLRARKLGLGSEDLIRMHEGSLATIANPKSGKPTTDSRLGRAATFLANALLPMTGKDGMLQNDHPEVSKALETLSRRTNELALANADLKEEVARGLLLAESLRTSEITLSQLLRRSHQMQEELRRLSRRLLVVQEEERRLISRELHDVLAQSLSSISMRLAGLKSQTIANAKDYQKKIATTWRLVEDSVEIIHRFARDLRPAVLDDLGLVPALKAYVQQFSEQSGIHVTFSSQAAVSKIGPEANTALYRVAQESLSNVARHSKASHVQISLKLNRDHVIMQISDNGTGFNEANVPDPTKPKGIGVLGMHERVAMLGGTFEISSPETGGTLVVAELPSGASDEPIVAAKTSPAKRHKKPRVRRQEV